MVADNEAAGGSDGQRDQLLPITDNLDIPFRNRVWRKYRPPYSQLKPLKLLELALHPDKWGTFVIGRKTIKKRMRAKLLAIKIELRRIMHDPIAGGPPGGPFGFEGCTHKGADVGLWGMS